MPSLRNGCRRVVLNVATGRHVACSVIACEGERRKQHQQPMLLEQLHHRNLGLFFALSNFFEDRALFDGATHDDTHNDQHDAEQERHTPAPLKKGVTR